MKRQQGSVADVLTTGLCILAMTIVMLSYMGNVSLMNQKMAVGQLARKYILRMETVGHLQEQDKIALQQELESMGITEVELDGTTFGEVGYGTPITLRITGKMKGEYPFEELRTSTAKN